MIRTFDPAVVGSLALLPYDNSPDQWDAFVQRAPNATFCHVAGWREIMTDVLGHECLYRIAADQDGTWQGVLPLVRVRSPLFGHYLVSMPFLNYGGPLGTAAAQQLLVDDATTHARRSSVDLLELRTRHAVPSALQISNRKITVVLDLPDSPEVLWRKVLPSSRRRQIERAKKEGLETRFGPDQVEPFYEVFAHNMRDLGTPVLPRRLFEQIARIFPKSAVFGVTYANGTPLAGGCGFTWGDEFEITWVSSLRQYDRMMPNMFLYWSYMQHLILQGVRVFNFGRCTPNGRTHRFKHQWGGVDVPLPWLQWSPREIDTTPSPERPIYRVATALWSRVPVRLANLMGPVLARQIP
ncbi:MAG TPA: FemAB family XrtA/PEP-CTERM system-associated protein [Gemmatimonadales bacterium]